MTTATSSPPKSPLAAIFTVPNQLTLGRFLLAIALFVLIAYQQWLWCFAVFSVAAFTDWLDGYLARKHNQITSFGRVIDPFVDKMLVIGAYLFMAGRGFVDHRGEMVDREL